MNHKQILEKYKDCKLCSNCQNSTKVFGCGNLSAKIAIVGEGPGKDEVSKLIPFVGPAGQLLDKILASIHLRREDLYFTNAVLCRTDDKNRAPTKKECTNCRSRLFEELLLIKPRYTLLVGGTALKTVMGDDYAVMKTHGQWFTNLESPCYFYFSLLHPAWILHSATEGETKLKKKTMWEDIKEFKSGVDMMEETLNWGQIKREVNREFREGPIKQILSKE
jgi:DNA polymerase